MLRSKSASIPAAPRLTLLQWIESDDGDTTNPARPACTREERALHARILLDTEGCTDEGPEPLPPPPGLRLAPLG
jgi:hypothetical protein